jgi:hypothetical protein
MYERGLYRHHTRQPRSLVEDRKFAEHIRRSECREDHLLPLFCSEDHFDQAFSDDEQLVSGIPLTNFAASSGRSRLLTGERTPRTSTR